MYDTLKPALQKELEEIKEAGLFKKERIISSPQGAEIIANGKTVLNFCANNYLGLSSHPKVIEAAERTIETHGYGMSSVGFICGTQKLHKNLSKKNFLHLGTYDNNFHVAPLGCNGGVFYALL